MGSLKSVLVVFTTLCIVGLPLSFASAASTSEAISAVSDFLSPGGYKGRSAADRVCYMQIRQERDLFHVRLSVATIPVPYDFILGSDSGIRVQDIERHPSELTLNVKDPEGNRHRLIVDENASEGLRTVIIWNTDKIMNTSIPSQITCRFRL